MSSIASKVSCLGLRSASLSVVVAGLLVGPSIGRADAQSAIGTWQMENGKVTVQVDYCGEPAVCARIVSLAKPLNKQGKPKTDKENPVESLRSRPLIGLEIMSGMTPTSEGQYQGQIYNADDGNVYRSTAVIKGDTMIVKGHWGPFSKKTKFVRID
jgi:uncharacterized protein (DUF2147 family)